MPPRLIIIVVLPAHALRFHFPLARVIVKSSSLSFLDVVRILSIESICTIMSFWYLLFSPSVNVPENFIFSHRFGCVSQADFCDIRDHVLGKFVVAQLRKTGTSCTGSSKTVLAAPCCFPEKYNSLVSSPTKEGPRKKMMSASKNAQLRRTNCLRLLQRNAAIVVKIC